MVYRHITSFGPYLMFPTDVMNIIGRSLDKFLFMDIAYFFDSYTVLWAKWAARCHALTPLVILLRCWKQGHLCSFTSLRINCCAYLINKHVYNWLKCLHLLCARGYVQSLGLIGLWIKWIPYIYCKLQFGPGLTGLSC